MDVTDIVDYNIGVLNTHGLSSSFFCLDREDPTVGFSFDASRTAGNTYPASDTAEDVPDLELSPLELRLNLGSHLARHIQSMLWNIKGYTCTIGVSTSKLLAKLVGNVTKPKGLTTLVPPYEADEPSISNVTSFIDAHEIGKIPGIGFKIAHRLRTHILSLPVANSTVPMFGPPEQPVTVKQVREFPGMNISRLDQVLRGPGFQTDVAGLVWNLLHGIDDSPVGEARDVPRQISIEDSYARLDTVEAVVRELKMLAISLIKRMRVDLLEESGDNDDHQPVPAMDRSADQEQHDDDHDSYGIGSGIGPLPTAVVTKRWLAHPKTLRVSTRPRPPANPDGTRMRSSNRISRSGPLPNFIFSLKENVEALAERLVAEALLPMFRKLHPSDRSGGWDLSLLNVAVTNMADAANDKRKGASGRDISKMFERQEDVLKAWRVADQDIPPDGLSHNASSRGGGSGGGGRSVDAQSADCVAAELSSTAHALSALDESKDAKVGSEDMLPPTQDSRADYVEAEEGHEAQAQWEDDEMDDDNDDYADTSLVVCEVCGARMPGFATVAHARFHELGGGGGG